MQQENPRKRPEIRWNNAEGTKIPGIEHRVLASRAMKREVGYNIYLPEAYHTGKERFPVIYFLHGAGGNENSDAPGFTSMLRWEIKGGRVPPSLCIFPNGGMSQYRDNPATGILMETLLLQELIPLIDRTYRTIASPSGRAICGFSMGGGGAVRLTLKYPDRFGAAGSWAAYLPRGGSDVDPSALARKNAARLKNGVRLLMIVGADDFTREGHQPLLSTLKELKIPHTYKELPRVGHNLGLYHRQTGTELISFVGAFPDAV